MQTIHIQQFNAQYNVARTLDNPTAMPRRLDGIARSQLTQVLEDRLSNLLDHDQRVCFIGQIDFNLTLDLNQLDDRQLAIVWADAVLSSITKTLHQGSSGVMIFHSRSEFISNFLEDLLRGQAWDHWYYQEFVELRSLSISQLAAQVLLQDGDTGREALLELTKRNSLDLLLATLSDPEVEAIATQCLLPDSPTVILPNSCGRWVEGLRSLLRRGIALTSVIARDVTRLYLGLLRQQPELGPDVNLARFIQNILHLRQTVMGFSDRSQFLSLLMAEDWTEARRYLGRSPLQPLLVTLMREMSGVKVVELLQELQVEDPQPLQRRFMSDYGGIFLLAGAIADLELDRFLQNCSYPEPEGISKTGLLLFASALQCLGAENATQAINERSLAVFAGLTRPLESTQLQAYAEGLTPEMHCAFRQQFQAHREECLNRPALFMLSRLPPPTGFDWFSLSSGTQLLNPEWDAALSEVSASVLQGFAAKLGAFSDSSPAYLCRNFLKNQAEIEIYTDRISVHFLTCPLQMVLRMAGFDHNTWNIPWLEDRSLAFTFE